MSYETLYRKYRSRTFGELIGQRATMLALQGAIASGRVAHAYLFSGTRGTGKTTSARLLAKAVNCLERPPGASEPCNACASCEAINRGAALDLIEIDAASNRGIDEIRELRERVNLAPAMGRSKVYIIDEAHMLTTEAFNALLKTLEEPPAHVVFILCTTDPQKVPLTVLGRCQHFTFRRIGEEQIVRHLAAMAEAEGAAADPEALQLVARVAQGSMRDAIGLLDQLIPAAGGTITAPLVRDLLGVADPVRLEALVAALNSGDASAVLRILEELYESGAELRLIVRGVMETVRGRLVAALEAGDQPARRRLSAVLRELLVLDGEVRRHAEPRFLTEATLVRIAAGDLVEAAEPGIQPPPGPAGPAAPGRPAASPEPVSGPDASPAQPRSVSAATPGGGQLAAWETAMAGLSPLERGYFQRTTVERGETGYVVTFRYNFHHGRAILIRDKVLAALAAADPGVTSLDLRLAAVDARPAPAASPEQHPVVLEASRRLEATITRVEKVQR